MLLHISAVKKVICSSDEADDSSGRRGSCSVHQPGQHPAAVRVRAAEGERQASERPARVTHGQATGTGGKHGRNQEHAHLHVQVCLRA